MLQQWHIELDTDFDPDSIYANFRLSPPSSKAQKLGGGYKASYYFAHWEGKSTENGQVVSLGPTKVLLQGKSAIPWSDIKFVRLVSERAQNKESKRFRVDICQTLKREEANWTTFDHSMFPVQFRARKGKLGTEPGTDVGDWVYFSELSSIVDQ